MNLGQDDGFTPYAGSGEFFTSEEGTVFQRTEDTGESSGINRPEDYNPLGIFIVEGVSYVPLTGGIDVWLGPTSDLSSLPYDIQVGIRNSVIKSLTGEDAVPYRIWAGVIAPTVKQAHYSTAGKYQFDIVRAIVFAGAGAAAAAVAGAGAAAAAAETGSALTEAEFAELALETEIGSGLTEAEFTELALEAEASPVTVPSTPVPQPSSGITLPSATTILKQAAPIVLKALTKPLGPSAPPLAPARAPAAIGFSSYGTMFEPELTAEPDDTMLYALGAVGLFVLAALTLKPQRKG